VTDRAHALVAPSAGSLLTAAGYPLHAWARRPESLETLSGVPYTSHASVAELTHPARPAHREATGAVHREAIAPSVTHTDASETSERQPRARAFQRPTCIAQNRASRRPSLSSLGGLGAGDRIGDQAHSGTRRC
jgi:hypothetical protein